MKKVLFGFVVLLGLSVSAKEVVSTEKLTEKLTVVAPTSEGDDLLKISIHIDWGRKSRGCAGFGICSTDIVLEGQVSDFLGMLTKDGRLNVEITPKGLESIVKTFGGKTIIIEENFTLSNEFCKELGLREGYTIKAGKYSVAPNASGVNNVIF